MNTEEITKAFEQLENCDEQEIKKVISKELAKKKLLNLIPLIPAAGCIIGTAMSPLGKSNNLPKSENEVVKICEQQVAQPNVSLKIKEVLKNNENTVNCFLQIAQIVAPAVAQVYLGLSALAIVGAVLVLCQRGIQNYLTV